jgi:NDP-sugar pyrophosphorylase family protein
MFKEINITDLIRNHEVVEKYLQKGFKVQVFKHGKLLFVISAPENSSPAKKSLKNRPKIKTGLRKLSKRDVYEETYLAN